MEKEQLTEAELMALWKWGHADYSAMSWEMYQAILAKLGQPWPDNEWPKVPRGYFNLGRASVPCLPPQPEQGRGGLVLLRELPLKLHHWNSSCGQHQQDSVLPYPTPPAWPEPGRLRWQSENLCICPIVLTSQFRCP